MGSLRLLAQVRSTEVSLTDYLQSLRLSCGGRTIASVNSPIFTMKISTFICILSLVIWTANGAPFDLSNLGDQIRSRVNEALARAAEARERALEEAAEARARAAQERARALEEAAEARRRALEAAEESRARAAEARNRALARAKESGNYTCLEMNGGSINISGSGSLSVWTENGKTCYMFY